MNVTVEVSLRVAATFAAYRVDMDVVKAIALVVPYETPFEVTRLDLLPPRSYPAEPVTDLLSFSETPPP